MAQQTKLSLKRLIALLLAVVSILTCFCSCKKEEESKEKDNSAADTYLAMAQEFLDNDDIDSALDILNKGLVATQDERISAMIAELTAQSTDIDNETITALDDYNGTWAEESIGWVYGGLILDLAIADGTIELELSYTQGAPASRIASFTHTASTEEIKGNQLSFTFDDDGWGNLGNVVLDFSKETINCSISDVKFYGSDYSDWGFYDGKYTLYKNNNAHNAMGYTMDEYYQKFPENEPETPTTASPAGILIGNIYYDDIANILPISTEQLKQDIINNEQNKFFVNRTKVAFDIAYLLPIKGSLIHTSSGDEYDVYAHIYFTNNEITYEQHTKIRYRYYDIGGWVYYSTSSLRRIEIDGIVEKPFYVSGSKIGQFSYNEYPSGLQISIGELADDILYSNLNILKVDGEYQLFDITSVQVISGDYWENTYGEYLTLRVIIGFSNDAYVGTADIELDYEYYDAGGWELAPNYYNESLRIPLSATKLQPK